MIQHFLNKRSKVEAKHRKITETKRLSRVYVPKKKKKITLNGSAKKKEKKINTERNTIYKTFRTLRKKSKNSYYLNLTDKYKYQVKRTQDIIKEINGKSQFKTKKPPHWIANDKKKKDFSNYFDMVNYKILIKKLEKYGIKYQYIDWFKSYLNFWKQ